MPREHTCLKLLPLLLPPLLLFNLAHQYPTTTRIKTTVAVTALCPSQLHARLVIVPPPPATATDGSSSHAATAGRRQALELSDVTAAAHALGVRLSSAVGQLWAVRLAVGQPASVELQLGNEGPRDERLRLSVVASDVGVGGGGVLGQSWTGAGVARWAEPEGTARRQRRQQEEAARRAARRRQQAAAAQQRRRHQQRVRRRWGWTARTLDY